MSLIRGVSLTTWILLTSLGCTTPAGDTGALDQLSTQIGTLQDTLVAQEAQDATSRDAFASANDAVREEVLRLRDAMASLSAQVRRSCPTVEPTVTQSCEEIEQVLVNDEGKIVLGEIERVLLNPPGIAVVARIDSGASSSSLHAANITEFERDGEDWVRFDVAAEGGEQPLTVEREILRYVRVYQQADKQGTRRPVIAMRAAVGNIQDTFEFTLADRSHLEHGMILGRNFLRDIALVDVSRQYVQPLPTLTTSASSGL